MEFRDRKLTRYLCIFHDTDRTRVIVIKLSVTLVKAVIGYLGFFLEKVAKQFKLLNAFTVRICF